MSLRTKLTLAFVLVSLLGAGGTGAALIYGSFRAQLEQIAEQKLLLVENRARRLEGDLELIAAELTRLSTLAEVDLADGDLEPEKRVLRYARKDSTLFQMQVLLIDQTGTLLWEEPQHGFALGQQFGGQAWFQALRAAGGQPSIDDTGDTLRVAVPILRHEQFSGALVGILDRARPELLTRDAPLDLGRSGSAAVLSQDGAVRFELGDASGVKDLRQSLASQLALTGQMGKLWSDAGGRGWLYAFAPIPSARWALVVREARDELDHDLTRQLLTFLALLLIGLALALVTGLSIARALTRPLVTLSAKARAIAAGRFEEGGSAPEEPPGSAESPGDELQALSRAFGQMQRAIGQRDREIREASATLEQKVLQRTAELQRAQEALLVSNRFAAMGKTSAAIAHELKNSLNGLGMSIDLLTQGLVSKERGDAVRTQVRGEIARLRDISDNLNLVGAAPRLAIADADLHQLIARTLALLAPEIEGEGIEVERQLHAGGAPLWLRCDSQKLQTAILNLCKNALEAMAPASFGDPLDEAPTHRARRLELRTSLAEGGAVLEISDTGAGFSAEARTHLFEPFFTTKRTGTGLGLTIAQRVVGAHGGEIEATEHAGGGTSLRLWLPLDPPPADTPHPAAALH